MNRRAFVQHLAAAGVLGAGMGLAPALLAGQGQNQLAHFGIISGVFNDAGEDWQAALRQMAEFGYTELESRQRGPSAPEFLYFLRRIKLRLVACGVDFGKQLKSDWLDQPKALEAKYAVTYWPWFHPLETLTLSQLKEIADRLNRCGEECRRAGLRMAFHNHDRDFRLLEGKPVFDRLLELTDPKLVTVQLDLYWMVKAGMDPLIYFKRYPRRFELFHVKDMGPTPEKGFVAVGAGSIDFARIFAQARLAGVKHYIVELEKEAATTENAKQSAAYLRQLRF